MALCDIRCTETRPIQTPYLNAASHHHSSNIQAFSQPCCTEPVVYAIRKVSTKSWEFPKTLSGKTIIVPNRNARRLEPLSRKRSPPRSLFLHISRRQMASSANCCSNTALNLMDCRLGRCPVSFVQLWATSDTGHRGYITRSMSAFRCT